MTIIPFGAISERVDKTFKLINNSNHEEICVVTNKRDIKIPENLTKESINLLNLFLKQYEFEYSKSDDRIYCRDTGNSGQICPINRNVAIFLNV